MDAICNDFNSAVVEPSAADTDAATAAHSPAASVLTWWTSERIDELKSLWATGASAAIIAGEMQTTRNAVLGKVHRLKLNPRECRNGYYYGTVITFGEAKLRPRKRYPARPKTVYPTRESKPRLRVPRPNFKPAIMPVMSVITGAFVTSKKRKPMIGEFTKNQLRAMLTQAMVNTAAMEILP